MNTTMMMPSPDEYADRQRQQEANRLLEAANVGKRHSERSLRELTRHEGWAKHFHRARQVISEGNPVALLGQRGTGKTQLACCLINEWCHQLKTARYCASASISMSMLDAYHDKQAALNKTMAQFIRPNLLVLDEFQERAMSEHDVRLMAHLFDARYRDCRPTIIIGNLSEAEFRIAAGPSIVDRMFEGCTLMFDWRSFRRAD